MLARKKSKNPGKTIPQDWSEGVGRLLNETYKDECEKNNRYFDVYGQIYDEELLLIISYLSEKDQSEAPVTVYLSSEKEHISTEQKVKETQKNFIDLAGLFFDEIFSDSEWNEFEPDWQEVDHKSQKYFFKITRENINLTLEANKLLGEEFLMSEDTDEEEDINH